MKNANRQLRHIQRKVIRLARREQMEPNNNHQTGSMVGIEPITNLTNKKSFGKS